MRLVIRNIVKNRGGEALLLGVSYSFCHGKAYGIGGNKKEREAFLDCIAFEGGYDSGLMELDCGGKNCLAPVMVGQFLEEPAFPEFLTVREFLKYYIDINRRNIAELRTIDDYLTLVELDHVRENRTIKDFTTEERLRLQFLCFLISAPPVIIIKSLKNINNVDLLKDVKTYIDMLKKNNIVLLESASKAVSEFLCDEQLTIESGCIQGGV